MVRPFVVALLTSETSTIDAPGAVADTISTSSVFLLAAAGGEPRIVPLAAVVRVVAGSPNELRWC